MAVISFSDSDTAHSRLTPMKANIITSCASLTLIIMMIAIVVSFPLNTACADQLWAGVARVEITDTEAGPVNDPLFVKALVIRDESTTAAIITVDAVALGEIGYIKNDYLDKVRSQIEKELNILPANVLVNASHCHGVVCSDVDERTVRAVKKAFQNMVPVTVGVGRGYEDRITENRRLKLKNGREADVRHAYSLPPDEDVVAVGPVDPEIGILRLDREDGRTLAVLYNFACHPIQGVPSGGNTADIVGFASKVIEDNLADGAMAFFLQGCAGDINPALYKDVDNPRDAEPLGNMLGLSAMRALTEIPCREGGALKIINETIELPRANLAERIDELRAEQGKLLQSLRGTSLNLKTFMQLFVRYKMFSEFPSDYSHRYLHEKKMGRDDLNRLDAENRRNMEQYMRNIFIMEQMTRNQINLALLEMHQADNAAAGKGTIDVEIVGMKIGDFVLTTFPGELTVQIGLNIKKMSPHKNTFVAGCTNGYIYYSPTAEQLKNVGYAQEDSDCLLAPEWQELYEAKAMEILRRL